MKGLTDTVDSDESIELANTPIVNKKHGTQRDERDMDRMGKRQQLRRQFKFLSIYGFGVVLGCTWEYSLIGTGISLFNGGPAGGIWMLLVVCSGMLCVTLSFAEMVSMAPIAGGQYHWASELAPPKQQKFISYIVGWLTVFAWQVNVAGTSYAVAQQIQSLIALNLPSYTIKGWHGTLLSIFITLSSILWNTLLVNKLPLMEGIALTLHMLSFFAFVVVLWVMGPRANVHDTWTEFDDPSGWGNKGLATLVGILGPSLTIGGSDLAVHLAEEVEDAADVMPRAMVATSLTNYILAIVMTVTVFSNLGTERAGVRKTELGQPWIQILANATESRVAANVMTVVVVLMMLFACINQLTAASRQLWSLARDGGLPFSGWLSHVPKGRDIPLNSVVFTFMFTALVCLLIIVSPLAFNIIVALGTFSGSIGDTTMISCMLRRRLLGEPILSSRFNLGRAGILVNFGAVSYNVLAIVFLAFPEAPYPSLVNMNWSCLMFGVLFGVAVVYYFLFGRRTYKGPVEYVKKSV
ncbi:hypothetical protein COCVIDRAFT_39038 [Bipolaris victoriae FI3]|uniref:Amino acid permease/ SLC12A domain-containing protein n=1 Tax=Bipolaris victoriae (strain FI3) TaxID=930091 RepID=W7EIC7_BIPV3|nr:hypothetical protein COCVIDRAFT_39038 [Bipolaris victoriae FI3]